MNEYVKTCDTITYKEVKENDCILSSSLYIGFNIKNQNTLTVEQLLSRPLGNMDLGYEIGSASYIEKSSYYFIRTKAFQDYSFIPQITKESFVPMLPQCFYDMYLKKGDILLSKDSNIGECVILDKDYENCIPSGAIYRLPVNEDIKYYLFAMLKSPIFKEQLDFIVPKGATIRHAKTLFLKCKIPFPNINKENTIEYISLLTKAIVQKESLIKQRHKKILSLIETELNENQKQNDFTYSLPTYNEVSKTQRLDSSIYEEEYKKFLFLITNYSLGNFYISKKLIKSGNTPITRYIGNINTLKYLWVTPSNFSEYGTFKNLERINFKGNNNINKDCILLVNRGNKGDVGFANFYNFNDLKQGQHNQGIYRIEQYSKTKLLFILCCLNTGIYRKICGGMSVGSKMKELKANQIASLPFPNFPQEKQKEIASLYHNDTVSYATQTFTQENFTQKNNEYNKIAGIYELDKTAKDLKTLLSKAIKDIADNKEVKIVF